jgi:hypothetical protein
MVEILNYKKAATIITRKAAVTNLNVSGNFKVPLQER